MSWALSLILTGALFVAVLSGCCALSAWHQKRYRRISRRELDQVHGQFWSRDMK